METPIFDITFKTPLPKDLIKFLTAFSGVIPVITPWRTRSSALSIARYGFTAAAPKPINNATWWTSRTSPDSTTKPTLVRLFSRIKWWCTAAVNNKDGIGAFSASPSRSDKTIILAPSLIAFDTSARISINLFSNDAPAPAIGNKPLTTCEANPG